MYRRLAKLVLPLVVLAAVAAVTTAYTCNIPSICY